MATESQAAHIASEELGKQGQEVALCTSRVCLLFGIFIWFWSHDEAKKPQKAVPWTKGMNGSISLPGK